MTIEKQTSRAQSVNATIKGIGLGVLLAGVLGAGAAVAIKTGAEWKQAIATQNNVVEKTISEACSPVGPYQSKYWVKGIDTLTASSALIKHPEKTQQICEAVNNSLQQAHAKGSLFADNSKLHAVADSLGLDVGTMRTVIAQTEQKQNQDKMEMQLQKASMPDSLSPFHQTSPSSSSMEPNL